MKKIVLFASGSGTNAENIIRYFADKPEIQISKVFTNNAQAGVIERAKRLAVPTVVFSKEELNNGKVLLQINQIHPDLIVLAGFLWKFPQEILSEYTTINIHPALLPKYGGKGMYGAKVHQAVLDNREDFTGITIHYANENYDEGAVIFQKEVSVSDCISVDEIAQRVHQLEHQYFPQVIENLLKTIV